MNRIALKRVGKIHTLLRVLSDPRMRCSKGRTRAISRLFLDGASPKAVRHAVKMGLVHSQFLNPFIIGHGDYFVGLTDRGDVCVDAGKEQ